MTDEEREKAIDVLEHNWTRLVNADYTEEELNEAFNTALKALKREEPKFIAHSDGTIEQIRTREQAKWLTVWESRQDINGEYDEWEEYKCSKCGFQDVNIDSYDIERYKFCPNCGAKMEGPK